MTHVRSFAEDIMARPESFSSVTPAGHIAACLVELIRGVGYARACRAFTGEITISRIIMRGDYSLGGTYYGAGLPVFELDLDAGTPTGEVGSPFFGRAIYSRGVRHYSRKDLRDDLRRIFPNAKIGR